MPCLALFFASVASAQPLDVTYRVLMSNLTTIDGINFQVYDNSWIKGKPIVDAFSIDAGEIAPEDFNSTGFSSYGYSIRACNNTICYSDKTCIGKDNVYPNTATLYSEGNRLRIYCTPSRK